MCFDIKACDFIFLGKSFSFMGVICVSKSQKKNVIVVYLQWQENDICFTSDFLSSGKGVEDCGIFINYDFPNDTLGAHRFFL